MTNGKNRCIRRLVVKVGTGTVTKDGKLNPSAIQNIARQIARAKLAGTEVFLVTSGQVAAGKEEVRAWGDDPRDFDDGTLAAIGAEPLLATYRKYFGYYGFSVAQGLVTRHDWSNKVHLTNLHSSARKLGKSRYIFILNENDLISRLELPREQKTKKTGRKCRKFGDNDRLTRMFAVLIGADAIIIFTEAGGVNGKHGRISVIPANGRFRFHQVGPLTSENGTGGMKPKVREVRMFVRSREGNVGAIADLSETNVVLRLLEGKHVGTMVVA